MITEVRSSIPLTLSNEIYIGHVRLEWMMRGERNRVALISIKEDGKRSKYSLFQHVFISIQITLFFSLCCSLAS